MKLGNAGGGKGPDFWCAFGHPVVVPPNVEGLKHALTESTRNLKGTLQPEAAPATPVRRFARYSRLRPADRARRKACPPGVRRVFTRRPPRPATRPALGMRIHVPDAFPEKVAAVMGSAAEELMVCRLVWGFFCQVVFWFVAGSLFGGVSKVRLACSAGDSPAGVKVRAP